VLRKDYFEHSFAHRGQILFEPRGPFLTGRTHINLQQPRLAFLVQQYIEPQQRKTPFSIVIEMFLSRLDALDHNVPNLRPDGLLIIDSTFPHQQLAKSLTVHHRFLGMSKVALVE
jgi:hypothetical protein